MLNELRVQYARRHQFRTQGISVDGPAITVAGGAEFGGARLGDGNSVGFDFNQGITQVIDNMSWIRGKHALKAGIDAQWIADERVRGELFLYTFPTIADYLAAKSGANPLGYTKFQQQLGDVAASYDSAFYGLFVQDDWQVPPRLKVLYGIRYDVFDVPAARPFAANRYSQDFTIDKNNFGPRAGLSWAVDGGAHGRPRLGRADVRAAAARLLRQRDPEQRRSARVTTSARVLGSQAGAPAFPASLAAPPPGFVLPKQSITAVDPDFKTQSAWLSNVQIERALTSDLAVTVGYVNSIGRNLPVLIDVNLVPSGATLADGRPISRLGAREPDLQSHQRVPVDRRIHLQRVHRDADQADDARLDGAGHLHARARRGQRAAHRDLRGRQRRRPRVGSDEPRSRQGRDAVQPDAHLLGLGRHRAAGRRRRPGRGAAQQQPARDHPAGQQRAAVQHPIEPGSEQGRRAERSSDRDRAQRRPAGPRRQSRPALLAVHPVRGTWRGELFFEAKNLFNTENIAGVNRVMATDALGVPIASIPGEISPGKSGYDQRRCSSGSSSRSSPLGLKIIGGSGWTPGPAA